MYENQYRCSLAVYFMKIVSLTSNISIYIEIDATGNGKDVVDVINTRDKRCLMGKC